MPMYANFEVYDSNTLLIKDTSLKTMYSPNYRTRLLNSVTGRTFPRLMNNIVRNPIEGDFYDNNEYEILMLKNCATRPFKDYVTAVPAALPPGHPLMGLGHVIQDLDFIGDVIIEADLGLPPPPAPAVIPGPPNGAGANGPAGAGGAAGPQQRFRLDLKKLLQDWMHDDGSVCFLYRFKNGIKFYKDKPTSNSETMAQAFDSGKGADVSLMVEDREIKAIKSLLMINSTVFDDAFQFDKGDGSDDNKVEIRGVEYDVMRELVRAIYVGQVQLTGVNFAMKIFMAADKYNVEFARNQAEEYIVKNITKDNVVSVINFGRERDLPEITDKALKFITPDTCKRLKTLPNYEMLDQEVKEKILENLFD